MRPTWDEYFMAVAKIVSTRSTCNSRPTGAVIVRDKHILATGYNGSPPGAPHCLGQFDKEGNPYCHSRAMGAGERDKFDFCRSSHAEANAVAQAARLGVQVEGASIYVTLAPCYVCTKLLASARIKHIYFEHDYESSDRTRDQHWSSAFSEMGIETWEKIRLSEESITQFTEALSRITSERRLPRRGAQAENS